MNSKTKIVLALFLSPMLYVLINYLTFAVASLCFGLDINKGFSLFGKICNQAYNPTRVGILFNYSFIGLRLAIISILLVYSFLKRDVFYSTTALFIAVIDIMAVLFIIADFYVDLGFSNKESSLGFLYIFGDTWKLIAIVIYVVIGLVSIGITKMSLLKRGGKND